MIISLCTKCNNKLAISPEGLCNICDEDALVKRQEHLTNQSSITALDILEENNINIVDFESDLN